MSFLSRYTNRRSTYEDDRGNVYARRYTRVSKDTEYVDYNVVNPTTLDVIALQQYGTPLMYWIIADFNDMLDPTVTIPAGSVIKLPKLGT